MTGCDDGTWCTRVTYYGFVVVGFHGCNHPYVAYGSIDDGRRMRTSTSTCYLTAIAVVLAGCAGGSSGGDAASDDPGPVHVHGVAPDPNDRDAVVVATHTGLFRIVDGVAERVGDGYHDLMGFTVGDDGTFYASGHPDLQSDHLRTDEGDPHLGLIRSTDGGHSWESVSLLGEVDFHALTIAGSTIVGGDATTGRFLASDDGGDTWDERGSVDLVSLAADRDDAQRLLGSTPDGLVRSDDGGRRWQSLGDIIPGFVAADDEGFVVARSDATVAHSTDLTTWTDRGRLPGTPAALDASEGRLLAAVDGHGIFTSADRGETWTVVYRDPAAR
jgi:hypothetical protein